ncbi:hypothetical protein B0H13DRAFT_2026654 [Mycena leptocephala]|nr:hypothetical protein B0H13DRAFT_2026654 [Mycena leptocephala]
MLSLFQLGFLALALLSAWEPVLGRELWLERDGRAIELNPRRFKQNHPAVLQKLRAACGHGICAKLAGAAVTPLLAKQPECSQQDMADKIIANNSTPRQANMLAIAIEYRQAEKNTPPDFKTKPPTLRNSLNGLVQAQDPGNDPNVFFDPATLASVKLGAQANTHPFVGK